MVEVTIDSLRVSLMSQQRVVILKDTASNRFLPIWIGPCEADAITMTLQEVEVSRPLTHDLLKNVLTAMGGEVEYIVVADMRNDTFYARIVMQQNGRRLEIDSRPSDAIALAVRVHAPIYVEEAVLDKAAVFPEEEVTTSASAEEAEPTPGAKLDIFEDFVDSLDFGDESADPTEPPED